MTKGKMYTCIYSDCEEKFLILFDWTSHIRKHAEERPQQPRPSTAVANSGSGPGSVPSLTLSPGTGAGAGAGPFRAVMPSLASSSAPGAEPGTFIKSETGTGKGAEVGLRTIGSSNTTPPANFTRDKRQAFGAGDIDTHAAGSSTRPSSTAPIFRTTPKGTASPLPELEKSRRSTPITSTPVRSNNALSAFPTSTSLPPAPTKITNVASLTSSPTLSRPNLLAHMHPATSSLQTVSETKDSRTSIPSTKRGRSHSSSSASGSSTVSIVKRRPAFDQEEVDIDMDELRGYEVHFPAPITTTAAGAISSSTTYPAFAHPCVWAERRARFMLPYTLENAPCHQGFDTENELFAHYAWHVDQLGVDYECEVTTCRMKILSEEHMKTHYQQMHPVLPIPQELHSITNTTKPAGRAVSATVTTAAGGRSHSKRIPATPRESLTPTPPPSVPYINPPPSLPSKSRMQSKLQQSTILSEGGKLDAVVNGTFPYNSTTQGNPTTTMTHSEDDDEEEDPTPPMAFGPFFKKK